MMNFFRFILGQFLKTLGFTAAAVVTLRILRSSTIS